MTADVLEVFRFSRLAVDGAGLPVVGGLLDQTESFHLAWRAIDSDEQFYETLKTPDG